MSRAERVAREHGRWARQAGRPPGANPHDSWELGIAWAFGWHDGGGPVPAMIIRQARLAGLFAQHAKEETRT